MRCNIPSANCTLLTVKSPNDPYESNGLIRFLPPSPSSSSFLSLLMRCNTPSVNCTLRSVRHLTIHTDRTDRKTFSPSTIRQNEKHYTTRKLYSTARKRINAPYKSYESFNLLPPSLSYASNDEFISKSP